MSATLSRNTFILIKNGLNFVREGLKFCPKLSSFCPRITEHGVQYLLKKVPQSLAVLVFMNCFQKIIILSDFRTNLGAFCPKMSEILSEIGFFGQNSNKSLWNTHKKLWSVKWIFWVGFRTNGFFGGLFFCVFMHF